MTNSSFRNDSAKFWLCCHPPRLSFVALLQVCQILTLVTDAQIYLDLKRTGLRGPEAAAALREWEGFCLP